MDEFNLAKVLSDTGLKFGGIVKVRKIGENDYAITIPANVVREVGLKEGDKFIFFDYRKDNYKNYLLKNIDYIVLIKGNTIASDPELLKIIREQGKIYGRPMKIRKRGQSHEIGLPRDYVNEYVVYEGKDIVILIDSETKEMLLINEKKKDKSSE